MIRGEARPCYAARMLRARFRNSFATGGYQASYGLALIVSLSVATGCAADDAGDTSAGSDMSASDASTSSTESGTSGSDDAASSSGDAETGADPVGHEYGPCPDGIGDCPEGTLYACLTKITEGAVCAPQCEQHSDCPPPPPGGSVVPVCTLVDDRKRCILALCEGDDDCPTDMSCHIETPNWCHWPYN